MKSKYFNIHELVPKAMYKKYKERAWRFVDPRLIVAIDHLKEEFNLGTMQINNYEYGGNREWSGIRTPESPDYSPYSMHTFGKAFDIIFSHYTAKEVRNYIIENRHLFHYINGLELETSWVHIDIRNEDELVT